MHRNLAKSTVQLSVVALILVSPVVVSAQAAKVACVGDSITALPSSWCGTLSTKLGSGYMVKNFGVSGTNLAKGVSQPYWSSTQYTPSHTFAPNIVVIMLGTNDAFTRSWSSAKGHFVADYEELLDTYTSLDSKPKPYIIIPTPIGTSPFGHDGSLLATEVVPMVKEVAMKKMVPTIDAFALFGGAMFDAGLFSASDQVHPNAKGQQMIGDEVYKVLMSTGALGGSATAGMGATAGSGAGSGGMAAMAGAMAMAGANAGGAGVATAGVGATAGGPSGSAGTPTASGAGTGASASTPTAGNRSNDAGGTSSAGGAGGPATAGNTSSSVNPVGAAGSATVVPPTASGDDGGCRTAGSSTSNSGATAALVLIFGSLIRSRKRNRLS